MHGHRLRPTASPAFGGLRRCQWQVLVVLEAVYRGSVSVASEFPFLSIFCILLYSVACCPFGFGTVHEFGRTFCGMEICSGSDLHSRGTNLDQKLVLDWFQCLSRSRQKGYKAQKALPAHIADTDANLPVESWGYFCNGREEIDQNLQFHGNTCSWHRDVLDHALQKRSLQFLNKYREISEVSEAPSSIEPRSTAHENLQNKALAEVRSGGSWQSKWAKEDQR